MPVFELSTNTPGLAQLLYWFRDSPKINAWANDPALVKGVIGPAGAGKSEVILVDHFVLTREYPGIQQFVYRSTRSDAVASIGKDMQKYFWPYGLGTKPYNSQDDIFRWDNGSLTFFRGFDEVKTKDRYGSINYAIGWMAEAHMLRELDFETILDRIRQPGPFKIGVRWDAVSKYVDESHWLFKRIVSNPDLTNYRLLELKFKDNEENYRAMGRGDYVDMRYREVEGDPLAQALNLEGELPVAAMTDGAPVYPEYRPKTPTGEPWHFFPGKIKALPGIVHRGWDLAATTNYMACTWWQRQAGRVIILRTYYLEGGSVRQIGQKVQEISQDEFPPECEYIDRGDRMIKDIERVTGDRLSAILELNKLGINIKPGTQENFKRKQVVKELLTTTRDGYPMLIVSGGARHFHQGMAGGYYLKRSEDGRFYQPAKTSYSHEIEAFEHSIASVSPVREEDSSPLAVPTYMGGG